jgi:CBS domain-containing protein
MTAKTEDDADIIGTIGRCIGVIRDGLLTALIVVGIIILWNLWPALKQQLTKSTIEQVTLGVVSIKLGTANVASFKPDNLTMEAVGGSSEILEKGSLQDLTQAQLQGAGRIDQIGVSTGHTYSGDLLLAYISRLAPKFVIFRNADKLEAWIDAGLFAAQLNNHSSYPYEQLVANVRELRKETISKGATARDALDAMQKLHLDHLPAVDDGQRFQFMLSRDEILSKVVTSVVLAPPPEH